MQNFSTLSFGMCIIEVEWNVPDQLQSRCKKKTICFNQWHMTFHRMTCQKKEKEKKKKHFKIKIGFEKTILFLGFGFI